MAEKKNMPIDFTDFLLDDEFIFRMLQPKGYDEFIKELKQKHPDRTEHIDQAVKVFFELRGRNSVNPDTKKNVWQNILLRKAKSNRMVFIRIAASLLILLGFGGVALYLSVHEHSSSLEKFAISNRPSFDQSQLILSDGQQIFIPDYESRVAYSSDGANVVINDTTEVVQAVQAEIFNQMIVPHGKYNSMQLSDGTKVWINSGSRLVYPPVFTGKTREVYVQGEAYFEVEKDKTKPFYVKTDRFRVEVSGTRFCVQANEQEDLYTALLLEGEVSVTTVQGKLIRSEEIKLVPGQLASLKTERKNFEVSTVEYPENHVAWKNGYLLFDDEPVNEVLRRVSRFYNITVEFRCALKSRKISGKLDLKDDPERVLRGISTIAKSRIIIEDSKYIIY